MKYVLDDKHFDKWFEEGAALVARVSVGDTGFDRQVIQIRDMTRRGSEQDVWELAGYLRPWNIETEGWSGRDFVRFAAMQALCFIGKRKPWVVPLLVQVGQSSDERWHQYDEALRTRWNEWADAGSLQDPYNDFLRCLKEVLDCIVNSLTHTSGEPGAFPESEYLGHSGRAPV